MTVLRPLIAVASLVAELGLWARRLSGACGRQAQGSVPGLQSTGSVAEVHALSCPKARVLFLAQGLNPRLLRWQAGSSRGLPGKPSSFSFNDAGFMCPCLY